MRDRDRNRGAEIKRGREREIIRIIKIRSCLEETLLGTGNLFPKFLRNSGFYLTIRNLSIAQLELISRYMHSLRHNGPRQFVTMI